MNLDDVCAVSRHDMQLNITSQVSAQLSADQKNEIAFTHDAITFNPYSNPSIVVTFFILVQMYSGRTTMQFCVARGNPIVTSQVLG